jgi:cytosine/uracil/thiamine/allantoin permease
MATFHPVYISLLIIFLAPWCAIYLTDAWLHRSRSNSERLLARLGGPYWYQGGINPAGLIAMIGGIIASALWLTSTLLQGPLSRPFGNSDLSVFTDFIVAALLYLLLTRAFIPSVSPAREEVQPASK